MKEMKIRITDEGHSRRVQEALFAAGYGWSGRNYNIRHTDAEFLFAGTFGNNEITYDWDDEKYFQDSKATEHFLHNGQFVTELPRNQPAKPLENIFIKLDNTTTKEIARKALEDAGYALDSIPPELFAAVTCDYVTGNFDGAIGYGNLSVPPSKYQERFVWQGKLVSENYFAAPKTSTLKVDSLSSLGSGGGLTYTGTLNGAFGDFKINVDGYIGCRSISLKSKAEHDYERTVQVAHAIYKAVKVKQKPDAQWLSELSYLVNLMEANK